MLSGSGMAGLQVPASSASAGSQCRARRDRRRRRAACGHGRPRALELPAPGGLGRGCPGHELGRVDPGGPAGVWGWDCAGLGGGLGRC